MALELTSNEVELLNAYQCLTTQGQKEIKEYLRYQLCKQYRREVMGSIFNNKLMDNLLRGLVRIIEGRELDVELVTRRIKQIKELYYSTFQKVHFKYSEVVDNLDSNEIVRETGRHAFENIEQALQSGNEDLIRLEVREFYQDYIVLSRNNDARKIIAV
ncbi:MAG: hypothetical protein GX581_03400 [Syntrophomonadaceae bacterium]|jgi:hypothetical protein|nr:hypothetical protein [Syntrophomonadaceae bacterium]